MYAPYVMMRDIFFHLRQYDWFLTGVVLLLVTIGLVSLFSLRDASAFPFFERQLAWVIIGVAGMAAISFLDFRIFRTHGIVVFLFYLFSTLLLLAVLFGESIRGVEAWFRIGSFSLQPAELAKLSLILLLAKFFSKRHIEIYQIRHLALSAMYLLLPVGLVLVQPDLGSALVLGAIWVSVVIFSGMKFRHILFLVFSIAAIGALSWNFLEPYQQLRIASFLNPYNDPQGAGYQMLQSMIAVGSGKLWGKGLGYGSQSHLNFLPEAETDFIFAAFAEEWGFFGVVLLFAVFFILLWRIIMIGRYAADSFARLYALAFAALIFVQSFLHIGMNMGALPITGLTLPFVSYGGSSVIMLLIGVGILQNIKINARRDIEED